MSLVEKILYVIPAGDGDPQDVGSVAVDMDVERRPIEGSTSGKSSDIIKSYEISAFAGVTFRINISFQTPTNLGRLQMFQNL